MRNCFKAFLLGRRVAKFLREERGAMTDWPAVIIGAAIATLVVAAVLPAIVTNFVTTTTTAGADSFTGFLAVTRLIPLVIVGAIIALIYGVWKSRGAKA